MKKRNISVTLECFVNKNGKYLMLKRNQNKRIMPGVWMAPGGHREFYEGLFECARREILEETGIKINNLKVKASGVAHLKDLDLEVFFNLLTADWESGEVKRDLEEGELVWLPPSEILKLDNLLSELSHILPHVFKDNGNVISYKAVYEKGNEMVGFEIEE